MTLENNKINLILDLDQTLISAEADEEYDFKTYKNKAKKFDFQDMDGYYIVFERPGLQEFLDFIFENFNVSIWTAASKDYALFIIDKIIIKDKPERKLDWIFFSYHCKISQKIKNSSKDLTLLWDEYNIPGYNKDNTIILDDYEEDVFNTQKDMCVLATPFYFLDKNSENDDFLFKLKNDLEKYVNYEKNPSKNINKCIKYY
jgi:hypothetical protein